MTDGQAYGHLPAPNKYPLTGVGWVSIIRTYRQLVENALTLDVGELLRRGVLARGSRTRGVISWLGPTGETAASVSYEADMTGTGEGLIRVRFSTQDAQNGGRRQVDQRITLTATRPGFGGQRWWFIDDGRRVARLHLSPGGDRFGIAGGQAAGRRAASSDRAAVRSCGAASTGAASISRQNHG